jgi:hypothetical protein
VDHSGWSGGRVLGKPTVQVYSQAVARDPGSRCSDAADKVRLTIAASRPAPFP